MLHLLGPKRRLKKRANFRTRHIRAIDHNWIETYFLLVSLLIVQANVNILIANISLEIALRCLRVAKKQRPEK